MEVEGTATSMQMLGGPILLDLQFSVSETDPQCTLELKCQGLLPHNNPRPLLTNDKRK